MNKGSAFFPYEQLCKPAGLAYISAMPKQSIIVARDLTDLVQQVREIILSARAVAARSVDTVQVAMILP